MNKKLYIGNISWSITSDSLREYFSQSGRVIMATVILDRDTGRSRGFGFVEMSTEEEAQKAIQLLNGQYWEGRPLFISEALPEKKETQTATAKRNRPNGYGQAGLGMIFNDFVDKEGEPGETLSFTYGMKNFTIRRED